MSKSKIQNIILQDVKIIWPNFRGLPSQYNQQGDRVFSVVIEDQDVAADLLSIGWPLKQFNVTTGPDEEPLPEPNWHMECKLNYKSMYPPRVYLVNSRGKKPLTEDTIGVLDLQRIARVDLELNPYVWSVRGDSGIKPYVRVLFAIVDETELDALYAELPELVSVFPSE